MLPTRFSAARWSSEEDPVRWVLSEAAWSGLDRLILVALAVALVPPLLGGLASGFVEGRVAAVPVAVLLLFLGLSVGAKGRAVRVAWAIDKRTGAITRNGRPAGWAADVTGVRVEQVNGGFFPHLAKSYDVWLEGGGRRLVATLGDRAGALTLASELAAQVGCPVLAPEDPPPHGAA